MRGASRRREFDYQPPSYDETVERADRQGSMYDNLFKGVKTYKAAEGRNIVRILPPTWPKASHYGYPIWVHYGVGPKEAAYLCLRENKTSPYKRCPLCEELYSLGARATPEDRKLLMPTQSIIYYILDRNQPQQGVLLWRVSGTADSEIAAQSGNRRKGSVLNIVDPERGYDLEFMRSGQKLNTRYRGYQVVREDSPMTDDGRQFDEVVDFIFDNPLPECLNFYRPEHIEAVYTGKAEDADDDDDAPRQRSRSARGRDDDDDDDRAPRRGRAPPPDDDDDSPPFDDDDDQMTRAVPRRSRLSREIDDEIPERGAEAPRRSRGRVAVEEDDDDDPPPPRQRARARTRDDDDDPPPRGRSRAARDDDDDDGDEVDDRRARMRGRLNRRD